MHFLLLLSLVGQASAAPLTTFELTRDAAVAEWQARHDLARVAATRDGMLLEIGGSDPYLTGPARDYPPGVPLQAELRLRSTEGGMSQLFYFDRGPNETQSVRFPVRAGAAVNLIVPLPPLGKNFRFRFDPPGGRGECLVERFEVRARPQLTWPDWTQPDAPRALDSDRTLRSGELLLRHAENRWGAFQLEWRGKLIATGHDRQRIGYLDAGRPMWIDVRERAKVSARVADGRVIVSAVLRDEQQVEWRLEQYFAVGKDGAINVSTEVTTSAEREAFFLPTLIVLPGFGTHGGKKHQAVFAGCEYLQDEPSSSTADIEGPGALRRVPAADKLTFPLMAVQHDDHFVGLTWHVQRDAAALFDSPDRSLGSGAHVLAIIAPGSSAGEREDGALLAHQPVRLGPAAPLRHSATILAGAGRTIVPAVQAYVAQRGWPEPPPLLPPAEYVERTARSWLDTEIRDGGRFRHALGGDFHSQGTFDAPWMLRWLAERTKDERLAARLVEVAAESVTAAPAGHEFHAHVGHIKPPAAGAVFDRLDATLAQARASARNLPGRFGADGVAHYARPPAGQGIDYARTHSSDTASGLAAQPVAQLFEAAAYSGDDASIATALARLESLGRFDDDVPRGAQTWEIPLHTPDILGSAHMVRAYCWGYQLTGERRWLDRAIYWAWTGVPFVCLHPSTDGPVGPYATIAVYGATQWKAPNWMGLPVQWCGLVYADALRVLARFDSEGPWRRIALGITASGMQQIYPPEHPRRGLLPDSFSLIAQARNPSDINPGTLQPLAMWAYGDVPAWDFAVLRRDQDKGPLTAHAAGRIDAVEQAPRGVVFDATPWSRSATSLAIHGLPADATVTLDARPIEFDGRRNRRAVDLGRAILEIPGERKTRVTIAW